LTIDYKYRDLKPDNILGKTGPGGGGTIWKLADFGLATLLTGDELGRYYTDTICGTPTYMAPEVCKRFQDYSFPADIWSLGAVMSYYCKGEHLFENTVMVKNWRRGPTIPPGRYTQAIIGIAASMNDPNTKMRPSAKTIVEECGRPGRQKNFYLE
jgi:serine/threonine protein kinase